MVWNFEIQFQLLKIVSKLSRSNFLMPLNKNRLLFKTGLCVLCIMFFTCCSSTCIYAKENSDIKRNHIDWISGSLPEGSIEKGNWSWNGKFMHNGTATHVQNAKDRIIRQSFLAKDIIGLDERSGIIQYVYLDPENTPKGIMLRLIVSPGKEQVFYWEGHEEVFAELDEYINAWYMGFIPDAGKWIKLFIDFRELDISNAEISGMEFILSNGRAWWGTTIIENSA
jgi:hypothetical protein